MQSKSSARLVDTKAGQRSSTPAAHNEQLQPGMNMMFTIPSLLQGRASQAYKAEMGAELWP